MFPKSDIIENRSKASVYEPPKLLFEVWMIFGDKYLWGIKRLPAGLSYRPRQYEPATVRLKPEWPTH